MLNLSDAEAREWAKSGIHASGEASPPLLKPTTPEPAPVLPAPSTLISPAPAADINSPPTPGAPPPQPQPAESPVPAPDEAGVGLRKARAEYLPQLTLADTGAPSAERGMDRGASSLGSPRRDTALLRQAWTVPKLSATRCKVVRVRLRTPGCNRGRSRQSGRTQPRCRHRLCHRRGCRRRTAREQLWLRGPYGLCEWRARLRPGWAGTARRASVFQVTGKCLVADADGDT